MTNFNLPEGANQDPLAPWNQKTKLCRYCDEQDIKDLLWSQFALEPFEEDEIEELVEQHLSEYPLCRSCAKEEYYDYTDED